MPSTRDPVIVDPNREYRTGIGTDIHRLVEGRELMLGGVTIPPEGLLGHSDGDVVLHAVIDSLLGAARHGRHRNVLPDTDPHWKDADSRDLLYAVKASRRNRGRSSTST